jgi:hypothetical protein
LDEEGHDGVVGEEEFLLLSETGADAQKLTGNVKNVLKILKYNEKFMKKI